MSQTKQSADTARAKAEILAHVHGIFKAFMHGDSAHLRTTHTQDWIGYKLYGNQVRIHFLMDNIQAPGALEAEASFQ